MPKRTTYNLFRITVGLTLLATLLAVAPVPAHAAGAVLCTTNAAGVNRAPRAQESTPNQAGLVIDFGDGRVITFCVDLGADGQATGEELLRASNLPVIFEYSGNGAAVCKIDTVGSNFPAESCFSHCTLQPGEQCMYWSYSQLVGDHWQFSQVGASSTVVHSGDINGWAWGESTVAHGAQPPLRTLADICLPATTTPTSTATPTTSATPTTTATPTPTATATATLLPVAPPPLSATPYVARIITATPTASPRPTSTPTTSPVVAPAVPTTSTPFDTAVPLRTPDPSTGSGVAVGRGTVEGQAAAPRSPTATLSATALPPTSAAPPTPVPANRGTGGTTRIQLPLIQHAIAATPSATPSLPTASPIARVESLRATPLSATHAPMIGAPPPPRPATPDDDPTRNYPYFGGMTALLLVGWVLLRRGRRSP